MEHVTISTDLLIQRIPDNELAAIVRYQSLWAMLERQPDDSVALRYMTHKQLIKAKQWEQSIRKQVEKDIQAVNKKRGRDKKSYEKQKDKTNSDAANYLNNLNKNNKKEKINKKEILQKFDTWWIEYPNKKSKQDALKVFEKIIVEGRVGFDELLAGAKAYAEVCRRENTDQHYIKHPSTWLNQGCWADEYSPPKEKNRWSEDDEDNAKWEAFFAKGQD